MTPLAGVLFDWRGTLVTVLDGCDWAREALHLSVVPPTTVQPQSCGM
jgi:hypothetical protein